MFGLYSEDEITWSSTEGDIPYYKVIWSMNRNGIPRYVFLDKNGEKIGINEKN